jgi:hypothetical protein
MQAARDAIKSFLDPLKESDPKILGETSSNRFAGAAIVRT